MKKFRNLTGMLLIIILLAVAGQASAEPGVWEMINSLPFISVAVTPSPIEGEPSIIIAGFYNYTYPGQTLKSTNGGLSWVSVLPVTATALSADPFQPNVIWAATPEGLCKSTDFGDTWELKDPGFFSWVIVSPTDSMTIFGDSLKSTDGGETWNPIGLPWYPSQGDTDLPHIKLTPADPNNAYAVSGNDAYLSTDGGWTWSLWGPGGVNDTVEPNPGDARYVYVGNCGGGSSYYFNGVFYPFNDTIDGHLHAFAVDPTSPNVVFSASRSSLVNRSLDWGVNWGPFSEGLILYTMEYPEGRMVFDPSDGYLYLPSMSGLWRVATWGTCVDADGDGYYAEPDCGTEQDCKDGKAGINPGAIEICDGIDNNCDGVVDDYNDLDNDGYTTCGGDCNDYDPYINPAATEICYDGFDNDCDNLTDCADPLCYSDLYCCVPTAKAERSRTCSDGLDNDCDGLTDAEDPDCAPPAVEICDNGVDDDGDGKIDCADRRDCAEDSACTGGTTPEICDNGIDDDGDGKTDCADKDCRKDPFCN